MTAALVDLGWSSDEEHAADMGRFRPGLCWRLLLQFTPCNHDISRVGHGRYLCTPRSTAAIRGLTTPCVSASRSWVSG